MNFPLFQQTDAVWTEDYWIPVLISMIVSGAFGGLLAVLQVFAQDTGLFPPETEPSLSKGKRVDVSSWRQPRQLPPYRIRCLWIAIGVLAGIGGAIAVMTVLMLDGKFDTPPEDEHILFYISIALIAGYSGFRYMNRVAQSLEERYKELARRQDQEGRQVDEMETNVTLKMAVTQGFVVAEGLAGRKTVDEFVVRDAVRSLSDALKEHPEERRCAILLARIHRHHNKPEEVQYCGNLQKAIKVLDEAISARKGKDEKDTADLLYNRACYKSLLASTNGKEEDKNSALNDLERSAQMSPDNASEAYEDKDFAWLKEDPRFKAICGKASA